MKIDVLKRKELKPNEIKTIVSGLLLAPSSMLLGGELWQSFLIESGISEQNIATYSSIIQIVSVLSLFLFAKVADNIKNVIKMNALFTLGKLPTFILFIVICLNPDINVLIKFAFVLALGIISTITTAIGNLCGYKTPYCTIELSRYGFLTGISGVLGGANSVIWSMIISVALSSGKYFNTMIIFFTIGFFMTVGGAVISGSQKEIQNEAVKKNDKKINLLKYPAFYWMLIPNVARGFHQGIYGLLVTLGYYYGILNAEATAYLVIIVNVAGLLSNLLYSKVCARTIKNNRKVILVSSIVMAVVSPLAFVLNNTYGFLAIYGICYIFYSMFNIAIPVSVLEVIDYQVAGQYSAGRLLLNSLGSVIATAICMKMAEAIGVMAVMIIAGCVLVFCGVGFYVAMNYLDSRRKSNENVQ